MFVNRRTVKRYSAPITFFGFLALLLYLRYRFQSEEITMKLLDNTGNDDVNDFIASRKNLPQIFMNKKIENNQDFLIKDDKKRAVDSKIPDKGQKSPQKCPLDPTSEVFTEKYDGYETLRFSKSDVYSEKFTNPTSTVDPVLGNPVIRLHPDRFLLPVLMRGPNNQLIGLRESVYVAIRLNRTLVIPRFSKHRTDSQLDTGHTIHPGHRVNFVTVCRFVSCVTIQQFRKACGNQADVILRLRHYSKKRISDLESFTGMRFSSNIDPDKKKLNLVPPEPKNKGETIFSDKKNEIKKLFDTQERCAIYAQPFMNMKVKVRPSQKHLRSQADLPSFTGTELYSEIIRHTPAPGYIRDISDGFVKSIFGESKFLTVHWRYDKTDWMKRCSRLKEDSVRKKLCDDALLVEPRDLAEAIILKVQDLKPTVSGITNIYIASPPSETEFIKATKRILNDEKLDVYYLDDISKFLEEHYGSCDFLWEHTNDIESTFEMQVCTRGSVFLRSTRSSWSSNVVAWRRQNIAIGTHPDKDEDVFELTRRMKGKRTPPKKA